VSEQQRVEAGAVASDERPRRNPLLHPVKRVAGTVCGNLRQVTAAIAAQRGCELRANREYALKLDSTELECILVNDDDRSQWRALGSEEGRHVKETLAADRR